MMKAITKAIRSIPAPTPAPIPAAIPGLTVEDESEAAGEVLVVATDVAVAADVEYEIVPVLGRYRTVLRLDGPGAANSSSVGSEQLDTPPLYEQQAQRPEVEL